MQARTPSDRAISGVTAPSLRDPHDRGSVPADRRPAGRSLRFEALSGGILLRRMRLFGACFLASRAWAVLSTIALVSVQGCFVSIADPAVDSTGGRPNVGTGGAQTGGAISSGGTDASVGGTGGAGGSTGGGGAKVCGTCVLPNVKTTGCTDGGCTIVECDQDFVDCDGKPDNGCETAFGIETGDASGAVASKLTPKIDGDGAEWSQLRAYPIKLPCTDCLGTQPGGQNGEPILGEPADAADLTATFRLAWDNTALYVFVQVHDDEIVAWHPDNLEQQDGIELLLNGDLNDINNQYSPDVHHLFVGPLAPTGTPNVIERNQQLQQGDIRATTQVAAHCYFVEMSLSWPYVMGRVPHTPIAGETHGFTIATNDWDSPPLTSDHAVRQTQYFWIVPGKNYSYETTGFGVVGLE
jgi:hypothetical protein